MKLIRIFSLLTIFIIFSVLALLNNLKDNDSNYKNPVSIDKSIYYQKFKFALSQNNITPTSDVTINPYTDKLIFKTNSPSSTNSVNIVFTTTKDPYLQTATLQKIFNLATIKGKDVRFIDLSTNPPYATLQDN